MKNSSQNWIFLRGLSREAAHWGDFPAAFEKKFPGVRVHALDLPGNGVYHAAPTPLNLKGLMEFVRAEWKKRNPVPGAPVRIFALSLGAMVALQWMHSYPDEIECAVFVNTSLRGLSPFYKRMSPSAYTTLLRLFMDRSARSREERILRLTSQHHWEEDEVRKRADIQKRHPVGKKNAFRQIIAALSSVESRRKPVQPVLLLNSLGDMLVHPDCSRAIAAAWEVPLKRHAWAGHDLTLDDPQWALQNIAEWLPTLDSRLAKTK